MFRQLQMWDWDEEILRHDFNERIAFFLAKKAEAAYTFTMDDLHGCMARMEIENPGTWT